MGRDDSAELMQALMTKLYKTVTGNDGNIQIPRNKFITWLMPSIPFDNRDFLFCSQGLTATPRPEDPSCNINAETKARYRQAFSLSKLFDVIPEVPNGGQQQLYNNERLKETVFSPTGDSISSVYDQILTHCKVANAPLTEQEQKDVDDYDSKVAVLKRRIQRRYWRKGNGLASGSLVSCL